MHVRTRSKPRPVEAKPVAEFRRIDLAFLKLARRREVPITRGRAQAKVELVLPVWGVTNFPWCSPVRLRNVAVSPFVEAKASSERAHFMLDILLPAAWANEQELERVFGDRGAVRQFSLIAECPRPPIEVQRQVEKVASKFEEIFIAFEADWREDVSVPLDPLIIGIRKGEAFLLAVYDPTKLEHYIASEFTTL